MARSKATITLDREKARKAAALVGGRSLSEVIDVALERLIQAEQLRHDVAAYARLPFDEVERALADLPVEFDLEDEDIDYEAIYGKAE